MTFEGTGDALVAALAGEAVLMVLRTHGLALDAPLTPHRKLIFSPPLVAWLLVYQTFWGSTPAPRAWCVK